MRRRTLNLRFYMLADALVSAEPSHFFKASPHSIQTPQQDLNLQFLVQPPCQMPLSPCPSCSMCASTHLDISVMSYNITAVQPSLLLLMLKMRSLFSWRQRLVRRYKRLSASSSLRRYAVRRGEPLTMGLKASAFPHTTQVGRASCRERV